jgi:hypothetical protein
LTGVAQRWTAAGTTLLERDLSEHLLAQDASIGEQ